MAHRMKKAEFLATAAKLANPKLRSFRGSVYLRDGNDSTTEIEIYRACNMQESGIISAINQAGTYGAWLRA